MHGSRSMMLLSVCLWMSALLMFSELPAQGEWIGCGVLAGLTSIRTDGDFQQYEGYGLWRLPWRPSRGEWRIETRVMLSAGVLSDESDDAMIGSVGPTLLLVRNGLPLALDFGSRATLVSNDDLGQKDIDGPLHFTSHVGLTLLLTKKFSIGCRAQHMSNAGIYDHNPGLNMLTLDVGYLF